MSDNGPVECERCGILMETPAQTIKVPGYRGTVVLRFCEDCKKPEKEKR